ncbi:MAG TPA: sulfatase, partial [Actinoplanes sp.]
RRFDPVLDWTLLGNAMDFVTDSSGRTAAIAAAAGVALLAVGLVVVMALAMRRLAEVVAWHVTVSPAAVTAATAVWITCSLLGTQVVPGVTFAAKHASALTYARLRQANASLQDQRAFVAEAADDAFAGTPGAQLLTGLRGKNVAVVFVESYGRTAVEGPEYAAEIGAVLEAGNRRLSAAGYASRSGFLTSPTAGGGSWLAQATFLSGLWINNQDRFRNLVSSDRLTLGAAFRRASWPTAAVRPGVTRAWPEGEFYGYDRVYDSRNLGYRGPEFGWSDMPDQYTLSAFERADRPIRDRTPTMTEIALTSSHLPWAPLPTMIDWDDVGDGSVYGPIAAAGKKRKAVWRDPALVRAEYRRSIVYSLNTLISYVETFRDDDLVLVFLGDHQSTPMVTGKGAGSDVPITVVARDRAVLDRIAGWGWQDGLKPGPDAPVWPMNEFRDRFLTAFGSRPAPPAPGR